MYLSLPLLSLLYHLQLFILPEALGVSMNIDVTATVPDTTHKKQKQTYSTIKVLAQYIPVTATVPDNNTLKKRKKNRKKGTVQ